MNIRRDKFKLGMPLLFDDTPVFITDFVVKDLQVENVAAGFEAFHGGGVGGNTLGVLIDI